MVITSDVFIIITYPERIGAFARANLKLKINLQEILRL